MSLEEKQFALDGVVFGQQCPVEIKADGWTPGTGKLRTTDVDRPTGDGIRMGRDFRGGSTWAWSLYTNGENEDDAWNALAPLASAWAGDDVRFISDEVTRLDFKLAGQDRCIFGRPRNWTPTVGNGSLGGRIDIECDFDTVDHRVYDADEDFHDIRVAAPLDTESGIVVPFIVPFSSTPPPQGRQDSITVGGDAPTPVTFLFSGPVALASATVDDSWTIALVDPVDRDDPVTVDGRPWVTSATKRSGGGVRMSPRVSRISRMWLAPGSHNIVFTGSDPSGLANLRVSWRNAYNSPRGTNI